jgi:hypothetical protein
MIHFQGQGNSTELTEVSLLPLRSWLKCGQKADPPDTN